MNLVGIRTVLLIFTLLFTVSLRPSSASYLFPIQSSVCMAFIQKTHDLRYQKPEIAESYLNALLKKITRNDSSLEKATPAIPEGRFQSSQWVNSLSKQQAIGRIRGIQEFLTSSESSELGKIHFTKFYQLEGQDAITAAFQSLKDDVKRIDDYIGQETFHNFKWIAGINLIVLSQTNWPLLIQTLLHSGSYETYVGVFAWMLLQLVWKQDYFLRRPLFWDYQFGSDLQVLSSSLDKLTDKNWFMISRNYSLSEKLQRKVIHGSGNRDLLTDVANTQSMMESLPLRDRLMVHLSGRTQEFSSSAWVGVDMILTKNRANGEPTLSLIIRGSEKGPPFPKVSTAPAPEPEPAGLGFGIPQLIPLPVRN